MEHGSFEWHEWRDRHANASEAAAVMDVGRFVPRNKRELSLVRNGSITIPKTRAMQMGLDKEAGAIVSLRRSAMVNGKLLDQLEPKVISAKVDGLPMSASLDCAQDDTWYEIKHVMSESSSYWQEALKGRIDKSVLWQMTHQFIVGREHGIVNGYLLVVCGGQMLTIPYSHDDKREEALLREWKLVWPFIEKGEVYGERDDAAWKLAAEAYISAKQAEDAASKRVEDAKLTLVALAGKAAAIGYGVSVTPVVKQGGYDYSKLPKEMLESLPRKPDSEYFAVNIKKDKR